MKKIILSAFALITFGLMSAQETKFGVKAGFTAQTAPVKVGGFSSTGSASGFLVGGFADFGVSDKMRFQPSVEFVAVSSNNSIEVPLLLKYSIIDKLYAMAGPGINYSLDAPTDQLTVALDLGASYDITDNFVGELRYDLGLTGIKTSGIYVSAGYKF
jgi:Outer membrane protein beta-barrel domain